MEFLFPKAEFLSYFRHFEVPFCSNEVNPFQVSLSLCHCWCPGRSTSLPWNSAGEFLASSRPNFLEISRRCPGTPNIAGN